MGKDVNVSEADFSKAGGPFNSFFEDGQRPDHAHPYFPGPCPCVPPEAIANYESNGPVRGMAMMFCLTHGGTRTIHTSAEEGLCDWAWGLKNKDGEPQEECKLWWRMVSVIPGAGLVE